MSANFNDTFIAYIRKGAYHNKGKLVIINLYHIYITLKAMFNSFNIFFVTINHPFIS